MRKALYVLYQPYKWFVYIPLLIVSTAFFGSLAVVLCVVTNPKFASFICGVGWARFNGYATPISVTVEDRKNIDEKQSYVIVSNHQSQFDIFVLYGWLGIDFKWIMKSELRKVPFLGIACEKAGHIFIDRSNHESALRSINDAKKNIINGTSVIFFPEGTRSKTGMTREFKKGAFITALDLGLPVLPVTIIGTKDVLPSGTINLMPGKVRLIIHAPISVEGFTKDTVSELMSKARNAIADPIKN